MSVDIVDNSTVLDNELSAEMEAKMKYKFANIEKRNEARHDNISKAREAEVEKGEERTNDVVTDFYKDLQEQVNTLEESLGKAKDIDKQDVPAYLDETHRKLTQLGKYVTDSVMFLPSYDVQKAQDIVKEMTSKFHDVQSLIEPKKKFGFKGSRQKKLAPTDTKTKQEQSVIVSAKPSLDVGVSLRNKSNERHELKAESTDHGDITLADLDNCKIIVHGTPSTVHMSNIKNCVIVAGPVSSSIFIENCTQTKFLLSSQQLRIHNTVETDFYIHVTSKAIIEDCKQVRFGEYPDLNWISEETWKKSKLLKSVNNWALVGDFNWLAADKPSPNWTKIDTNPPFKSVDEFLGS
eukprot:TRINITY_DN10933_c0_g1_i4.p1 TRINITY_DN10933_c0_g1~~TRINITY_DN10933_c0_g1_i4.p1  ORF type:complete len:350 (+),score=54.09 TRINITY_DN10933_c0_g1_i4:83-1132(+)